MRTYGKAQNARQNGGTKQSDRYQNRIGRTHQEKGRDRCKLSSNCQLSSYDQFSYFTFRFFVRFSRQSKERRSIYPWRQNDWAPKNKHVLHWIYRQRCLQKWSTPTYDVTIFPWIWFFFNSFRVLCTLITENLAVAEICNFDHSGRVFPCKINFWIVRYLYGAFLGLLCRVQEGRQVKENVRISVTFHWLLNNLSGISV